MESGSSGSGANSIVQNSVSPQVTQMYNQCIKFQNNNLQFSSTMMNNGMLAITATYFLGSGMQASVPPHITGVMVNPSNRANCSLQGEASGFPVQMTLGIPYNIICTRNVEEVSHNGADIAVTVNRAPGTFTVTMPDMKFQQIKDENAKLLQNFRGTVQSKIDEVKTELQKTIADGDSDLDKELDNKIVNVNNLVTELFGKTDKLNGALHDKTGNACIFCKHCGGDWPNWNGNFPFAFKGQPQQIYGDQCSYGWWFNSWINGPIDQAGTTGMQYCCKDSTWAF